MARIVICSIPMAERSVTILSSDDSREPLKAKPKPKAAAGSANRTRPLTVEEALACFRGQVRRRGVSFFYLIGLFVIATAMVLLPLLYLALIALVGYGMFHHGSENLWILTAGRSGSVYLMIGRVLLFAAPFLFGTAMIVFMLKPIFARSSDDSEPLTLDRSQEPTLYALIDRLCEELGASKPRRIVVDCSINAGAGFRRGFMSFLGRDMQLLIGLPYPAGLSVSEFVGVLAHEFGHFSQGMAMRLSYVVERVNGWFARVVYERDHWDDELVNLSQNDDGRVAILFYLTRGCIWLSRRVLWVLMFVGRMISCGMSRLMEYDADRRAAEVVGSEGIVQGLLRSCMLDTAWSLTQSDLDRSWKCNQLPENLPVMIAARSQQLFSKIQGDMESVFVESGRAGLFSTHPSLHSRIESVRREVIEGAFSCDAPATALFSNFKMVANAVTLTFYREVVGLPVQSKNLVKSEELIARHDAAIEDTKALLRYFQRCYSARRPMMLGLESLAAPAKPREALEVLRKARAKFEQSCQAYGKLYDSLRETGQHLGRLREALSCFRAGYRGIDKLSFRIKVGRREEIEAAIVQESRALSANAERVDSMNKLLATRMRTSLQLMAVPEVAAKLPNGTALVDEVNRILPVLNRFETIAILWIEMRDENDLLVTLLDKKYSHDSEDELPPTINGAITTHASAVRMKLEDMLSGLELTDYPFEHADGRVSVAKYLMPNSTIGQKPEDVCRAAMATFDRAKTLHNRMLSRIAAAAELVERVAGLKPMAEPVNEKEENSDGDGNIEENGHRG
jgi:Zn-dependent protease with chaperone function